MGAAILVAFGICAIGYATLRAAGLTKGVAGLGLAPAVGLATCIVWSSWLASIGTPPVAGGWGLGALTLAGAVFAWRDREAVRGVVDTRPLWLAWLAASLVVPSIAMGIGFAGQQAPLSTHDGAFHI